MLHPEAQPRVSYVAAQLGARPGPFVAATDYIRTFPDQIGLHLRTLRHARYRGLWAQRHPCQAPEVLRGQPLVCVAVAALKALADEGAIPASRVTEAIRKYEIDPEKPNPVKV